LFRRLQVDLKVIWDISVDRLVLDSVETPDGGRRVDIFRRGGGMLIECPLMAISGHFGT